MNILLTGGNGFVGKRLINMLTLERPNDRLFLLSSSVISGFQCILHKNYTFSIQDFLSAGLDSVDCIIHLGAYTPKSSSDANHIDSSISNIVNTRYLLQHLPSKPKKFIFISTLDVYGECDVIDEESPVAPSGLYGQSKLFCEMMLESYCKEEGIVLQILRLGHIYGPGEDAYQKLIPNSIRSILNGNTPVIYSDGTELRSFLYIDDCCRMIISAIDLDDSKGIINIVSPHAYSVIEIMNMIIKISGYDLVVNVLHQPNKTRNFIFSADKMHNCLGYEQVSLEEGLRKEYRSMEIQQ